MVILCKNCKNFIKRTKPKTYVNGSKHFETKEFCKFGHRTALSTDGIVPRKLGHICKDFKSR